jgi:hypothetical protein
MTAFAVDVDNALFTTRRGGRRSASGPVSKARQGHFGAVDWSALQASVSGLPWGAVK